MAEEPDLTSRILKYFSAIKLQTVVNYWSTHITRQSTSRLVGDFVHARLFRQVAKFARSEITGAWTSPHFMEIPAAFWTYNFGLSVPQLVGRQRFIGAFQIALRPVCAHRCPVWAVNPEACEQQKKLLTKSPFFGFQMCFRFVLAHPELLVAI